MQRRLIGQVLCAFLVGCAVAIAFSEAVFGTPEIAKKENQGCLVCHTAMGKADLNERGQYYKAQRTLEGYKPPAEPDRSGTETKEP